MLDHRFAVAHVSEHLDGDLSPAAHARIERHVDICPQCRQLTATLRQTLRGLRALGATPRRSLADGVVERLRRDD